MKKTTWIIGVLLLTGLIYFAISSRLFKNSHTDTIERDSSIPWDRNAPGYKDLAFKGKISTPDFVPVVKKVRPAVVKIKTLFIKERSGVFDDDFWNYFFYGPENDKKEKASGMGSGFFISPDGYILTNNHVIDKATKIVIQDIEGAEFPAKKIGVDPKTDLALLKIETQDHSFISLGDSDKLNVGEWVLAIGNPLGQDLSVTSGIISALGRKLPGLDIDFQDFIQTDTSINQGNSGGPLINLAGEAIGINSTILSTSDNAGSIGIGFAIPSNMAKKVVEDLKTKGHVIRGYLGLQIADISNEDAKHYNLPSGGVLVVRVEPRSPAQKAGVSTFDLITSINGKRVKSMMETGTTVGNYKPGDILKLSIFRGKSEKTIDVRLSETPIFSDSKPDWESEQLSDLGMTITRNNRIIAHQLGIQSNVEGLVITEIEPEGIADANNLQKGDIIIAVNRTPVQTISQFHEAMNKRTSSSVFLSIVRDKKEAFLRFTIPMN